MKVSLLTISALIATSQAGSIANFMVCTITDDCSIAGSACCDATKTGQTAAKICAPSASTTVTAGESATYSGFTVACPNLTETGGASKLAIAAISAVLSASYIIA